MIGPAPRPDNERCVTCGESPPTAEVQSFLTMRENKPEQNASQENIQGEGWFRVTPAMSGQVTELGLDLARPGAPQPSRVETDVIVLFDRHRVPLLRYLVSFGISPADGEELVQEVFLLLFRHLRQGKSRANLPAWLFTVAYRLGLRHRFSSKRRGETQSAEADIEAVVDVDSPGPEERLDLLDMRGRLLAVFRSLPLQDRQCLSLRAEGLRYREIASILGVSLGTVANSLGRALARLSRVAGY